MKVKLITILFSVLFVALATVSYSQELDEIVAEMTEALELSDEQAAQVSEVLTKYGTQLNAAMEANEDNEEDKDPKEMISQFKSVRDSYRDDLQKILSKEQYEKYQEIISYTLLEMFSDIAEIRLMDLQQPLEMTDEQVEQLAPVMGKSMMEMMKIVIEYGDKRLSMPRKVKIGKAMKKIQSEGRAGAEKILTPEQLATWDKMKEESKNKEG
jgi:hypothetical protein